MPELYIDSLPAGMSNPKVQLLNQDASSSLYRYSPIESSDNGIKFQCHVTTSSQESLLSSSLFLTALPPIAGEYYRGKSEMYTTAVLFLIVQYGNFPRPG